MIISQHELVLESDQDIPAILDVVRAQLLLMLRNSSTTLTIEMEPDEITFVRIEST